MHSSEGFDTFSTLGSLDNKSFTATLKESRATNKYTQ